MSFFLYLQMSIKCKLQCVRLRFQTHLLYSVVFHAGIQLYVAGKITFSNNRLFFLLRNNRNLSKLPFLDLLIHSSACLGQSTHLTAKVKSIEYSLRLKMLVICSATAGPLDFTATYLNMRLIIRSDEIIYVTGSKRYASISLSGD